MNDQHLRFPFPPRCAFWSRNGWRCQNRAATYLYGPDGKPNPGGYYCADDAAKTIAEYAEKLGEAWTTQPLQIG